MTSSQSSSSLSEVVKAADFAARKHTKQLRKDGVTPYINHPIGVAKILTDEGGVTDSVVIVAALLHDTVEDTDTTLDEIGQHFGETVKGIVDEVSDDKSLPSKDRKRLQIEHAANSSERAKLVKLADKLYNIRDLERQTPLGWSETRKQEYFIWASKVCHQLKGTNPGIEAKLKEVFKRNGASME